MFSLAFIIDFAVAGLKDLGGAAVVVVVVAGEGDGVTISLFFFLVFAQKDEQLFFHNLQVFSQSLKFLIFVVHSVVVVLVVTAVVVVVLYQFLE